MCEVLDKIVAEGEARGIEKTKTEMVLNMLRENLSVEMIARIAKLTVEQVMAISKKAAVLQPKGCYLWIFQTKLLNG